jgi:hypothetical protein
MQIIKALHCMSDGTPNLPGAVWRVPVLRVLERMDPFSKKMTSAPLWSPTNANEQTAVAEGYDHTDLSESGDWATIRQIFAARAAALHEGLAIEMWALVVGESEALSAWKPSWITEDGEAQLIKFPAAVTSWTAEADASQIAALADRWQNFPYLTNASGDDAMCVASDIIRLMQPMARTAVERSASILAEVSGYVLP